MKNIIILFAICISSVACKEQKKKSKTSGSGVLPKTFVLRAGDTIFLNDKTAFYIPKNDTIQQEPQIYFLVGYCFGSKDREVLNGVGFITFDSQRLPSEKDIIKEIRKDLKSQYRRGSVTITSIYKFADKEEHDNYFTESVK